jgi:SAM-dependent methyltransferase
MSDKITRLEKIERILQELGHEIAPSSVVLDFGCGGGHFVREMRDRGLAAFGCDIEFANDEDASSRELRDGGFVRLIDAERYRLPFEDDTFDFILSYQVFEHVRNYPEAVSEIRRVLKPGGVTFHIYTSRYIPIEPHVHVPLAAMLRSYRWLYLWAGLGIRNEFQTGMSAKETARQNLEYLTGRTNYLTKAAIRDQFKAHFDKVSFCEKECLKYAINRHGMRAYALSKYLPVIPGLVSAFYKHAILAERPHKPPQRL